MKPGIEEFDPYGAALAEAMEEMTKEKRAALERHMAGAEEEGGEEPDEEDQDAEDAVAAFLDPNDLQLDVLQGIVEDEEGAPSKAFSTRKSDLGTNKQEIIDELESMMKKMNPDQTRAYETCCKEIAEYKRAQAAGERYKGNPIFISGPGGTGKSFLLRAIRLKVHIELAEDLEDLTSVVTAPTGCAALNVDGDTVHHALSLPIQQGWGSVDMGMSAKKKQEMRSAYGKTHAFLFDEVSMISANQLCQIDSRLQAITGTVEPDVHFHDCSRHFWLTFCALEESLLKAENDEIE